MALRSGWRIGSSGFVNENDPFSVAAENYSNGYSNTLGTDSSGKLYNTPTPAKPSGGLMSAQEREDKLNQKWRDKRNKEKAAKNAALPMSSNREQAAGAFQSGLNNMLGIPTANAATGAPKPVTGSVITPTISKATGVLGDLFQKAIQPVQGMYANLTHGYSLPDLGLSESLGLTEQKSGGLSYNPGDTPATDPATGQIVNPSFPSSPYFGAYTDTGEKNILAPIWHAPTSQNSVSTTSKTPRPVSSPITTPTYSQPNPFIPQPSQSSSFLSPIEQVRYNTPQQDFTPPQQTPTSTQRQFLGNGYLSNGVASNGKGDYGVEGTLTGTDMAQSSAVDDLLTALGLKPMAAQAAETQDFAPMSMQSNAFNLPNVFSQPKNDYTSSPLYQDTMNRMYGGGQDETKTKQPTGNPGGSQGGGVAQQYSQPSNNSLALLQQQNKGFSAQEKAQQKATKELLKSIEKQYALQEGNLNTQFQTGQNTINTNYANQQTEGQTALEKAKQADLLRLSGLFNFNANQSPDSEQRIQYEQRAQDEANTQLKDLITKLAAAKGEDLTKLTTGYNTDLTNLRTSKQKDISSGKQALQQALASIADKRNANQQDIAKLLDALKQPSRQGSPAVPNSTKPSHQDVFDFVNEGISKGGTWQEIADQAAAYGMDTSTGSYLDQLLNRHFRG